MKPTESRIIILDAIIEHLQGLKKTQDLTNSNHVESIKDTCDELINNNKLNHSLNEVILEEVSGFMINAITLTVRIGAANKNNNN